MPDNDDNIEKYNQNHKEVKGQFPGANMSKDEPLTKEQMELPGNESHGPLQEKFKTKNLNRPAKKLWVGVGIFGLVGAALVLAWFLVPSKESGSQTNSDQSQAETPAETETKETGSIEAELDESYTNDFLRLTFKHPKSWQITDENDVILVKSPSFKYELANGSQAEGFFKIYIRQQAGPEDGKYLGRGYAIKPSEKVAYSEPQPGQRPDTFLSDFGLDTTDNFAYFVVQGVFDLKQGETLGPKYASEPDAYLITGGFGAADLADPLQTNLLPADSYASEQAYITAVEIVKSLQLK